LINVNWNKLSFVILPPWIVIVVLSFVTFKWKKIRNYKTHTTICIYHTYGYKTPRIYILWTSTDLQGVKCLNRSFLPFKTFPYLFLINKLCLLFIKVYTFVLLVMWYFHTRQNLMLRLISMFSLSYKVSPVFAMCIPYTMYSNLPYIHTFSLNILYIYTSILHRLMFIPYVLENVFTPNIKSVAWGPSVLV